jgi:glycosyltransferase involved in cell wall biosynthesis
MAARRGITVGLARHASSEGAGTSVQFLFESIEKAVGSAFRVRKLSPWFRNYSLSASIRAADEFLRGCDVVITTGGTPGIFLAREKQLSPPPILYLALGEMPRGASGLRGKLKFFLPGDKILFSCRADAAIYGHLLSACPASPLLVPFGTDTELFRPLEPRRRANLRSFMGLSDDDILFLYVGRITAEKNLQTALAVLGELAAERPNVKMQAIGSIMPAPFWEFDPRPRRLEKRLRHAVCCPPRSLRGRYSLWPALVRSALPDLYGCADVFINMTLHHDENFGYTQVEAMACGLPVVASDWGGLKDTVEEGISGFKIPTVLTNWGVYLDRFRALKRCQVLADSAELRNAMGLQARRRVMERYSLETFRRDLVRELEAMVCGDRSCGAASSQHAVLSPFGARYNLAFTRVLRGPNGCPASIEVDAPQYNEANYDLYAELIAPYCSGHVDTEYPPNGRLFLSPLNSKLRGNVLQICDLLWPRSIALTEAELIIVKALMDEKYRTARTLLDTCGAAVGKSEIEDALRRLIADGVITHTLETI